jgi:outer membrane protein OmpA-like peptidoglycan-associated protein
MKNTQILSLALFLGSGFLFSQKNVEWKKENFPGKETEFNAAYKTYIAGEKMFYDGPPSYEGALAKYLEAYQFNPENDYLNFHIGHIYFAIHHPKDAEKYYEKAISLNPKLRELVLFELADAYHQDGEWDNAISHYKEYKTFLSEGGHKHINMHQKDVKHELKYADLCIRQCETGKILSHDTVAIIFENISPAINTKYPEYSAVVDHEEDLLVFVSRRPSNTGDKQSHGEPFEYDDIYFSRRTENGWSKAEPLLGEVNTHAHEAPVWINGKGTRLLLYYNKSKKPNLHKQGDVYESDFVDGKWTAPKSMKMINSSFRETHASISDDGKTIYFTTNNPKYAKHGGMDIVKTIYNDATGKWSEPVDIGGTINTEWDEESPFIKPDGKHFYFSSQGHTSIGGFDFFKCELLDSGKFSEPINLGFPLNTPYDDAFIYVSDDGQRVFFNSNRIGGFGANDIYEGFILSAVNIPVEIIVRDARTHAIIEDATVTVEEEREDPLFKEIVAANSGKYSVYVGVEKTFKILVDAPSYISHQTTFNTRFDKILDFDTVTIRQTVYIHRDDEPIAFSGQLFDKVTGNPVDGIVEITINNEKIGHLTTVNSKFSTELGKNVTYTVTSLAKGHMPYRETFKLTPEDNKRTVYLDRIKVGDRFTMRNVLYESGKATIKEESITELEILKEFMTENPYVRLEVSAHTDSIGTRATNMKLSDSRAKSIYTWLTTNGIAKERITFKGYGPDVPIAPNATPEGRTLNRRSEIKILED